MPHCRHINEPPPTNASLCRRQYSEMADGNHDIATDPIVWFEKVREHLLSGSIIEMSPRGYSMWPTIHPGEDTIYIKRETSYRCSDIVLASCDSPRGIFLHRINKVLSDGYILMGDSNLYQTEICATDGIIGKVVGISRNGRDIHGSLPYRLHTLIQRLPHSLRRQIVRIINLRKNGI